MSAPARRPTLSLSRPLDPITAERLQQAGVSLAEPAEAASTPPPRHVPADPETLAHNQAAETVWYAAQARIVHQAAEAETLAWNKAREDEWLAAQAALEAARHAAQVEIETLVRDLAPLVFNDAPPPLAIGIDVALVELLAGEFEAPAINRFMRGWVRRDGYLQALARGDVRRDLDGCPAGTPDAAAQRYAAILLSRRGDVP